MYQLSTHRPTFKNGANNYYKLFSNWPDRHNICFAKWKISLNRAHL